jgi:hypothetical protein
LVEDFCAVRRRHRTNNGKGADALPNLDAKA